MSHIVLLHPMTKEVCLDVVAEGIAQSISNHGFKVALFSPIEEHEPSLSVIPKIKGIKLTEVESLLLAQKEDILLETLVSKIFLNNQYDVVLVSGLLPSEPYFEALNRKIADALGADVLPLVDVKGLSYDETVKKVELINSSLNSGLTKPIKSVITLNVSDAALTAISEREDGMFAVNLNQVTSIQPIKDAVSLFWLNSLQEYKDKPLLTPPAFRYKLTDLASRAGKRIVLPEGNEPRTVKAAALSAERHIAHCVLLGNRDEILLIAKSQNVQFGEGVEIVDPELVRENYVARLVELRKSKGMTEEGARQQLLDNVVLGTMMLECGEVDGLVSGAVHTTANTIRPPLQIIKTAPGSSLVSSVFFMLFPDQVLVFGDCAINLTPTAQELADIAIQSADSAKAFDIEPRVAMLSYSTINSGAGPDVDLVREATELVKQKRPDILVDGPLQYDAAVMMDVAQTKAPNSPVAGSANVLIFPNLNAGNIGYKAVQRAAGLVSIGPMLQGMRKPVNDLSRGALVDDIIYTIALTAIQAKQAETN